MSDPLEWQPIETAPKNGAVILIYRDRKSVKANWLNVKEEDVYAARWMEDFDSEDPWQVLCSEHGDNFLPDDDYITHWMPLPDPPKESE